MEDVPPPHRVQVATARCARLSYLTHEGEFSVEQDVRLHDQLRVAGHWSPFEHCAVALPTPEPSGNFAGWRQYRKMFAEENRPHPLFPCTYWTPDTA